MLFQYGVCWDDLKMKNSDYDNLFLGHQLERMYNDFKTKEVPNWLTYSFMIIGGIIAFVPPLAQYQWVQLFVVL